MGYYTQYDISENSEEIIEAIENKSGYSCIGEDVIKWYSCRQDMREVSLLFPDTVLVVSGEGEESGDIWKAYYKNGKEQMEKARIVIADFDESKLQ